MSGSVIGSVPSSPPPSAIQCSIFVLVTKMAPNANIYDAVAQKRCEQISNTLHVYISSPIPLSQPRELNQRREVGLQNQEITPLSLKTMTKRAAIYNAQIPGVKHKQEQDEEILTKSHPRVATFTDKISRYGFGAGASDEM